MRLRFYSIIPSLSNEVGHFLVYALAVDQAAYSNGWIPITLIPKKSTVTPLKRWRKWLPIDYSTKKTKLFAPLIFNFFFFISLFRRERSPNAIFFIEQYTIPFLAAICLAAVITRPKGQFWHLLRYPLSQMRGKGSWHTLLHRMLLWGFGPTRLRLLTDSELVQKENEKRLGKEVFVVPIPHTKMEEREKKERKGWACWWPGAPRKEKGKEAMEKIAKTLPLYPDVELFVSEELRREPPFHSPQIHFVTEMLSRDKYEEQFSEVDFIFLPYNPRAYVARTSGILVEAVVAGKIPLTTEGSWMAYELKKFGLEELLLDWEDPAFILGTLPRLAASLKVREKLAAMRREYQRFHSLEQFSIEFQRVADGVRS